MKPLRFLYNNLYYISKQPTRQGFGVVSAIFCVVACTHCRSCQKAGPEAFGPSSKGRKV
ncbi:unnamed protein product [Amoebophrya sp. A120]|nr:unnamed protein product [Amoebophrya sp. A120]|eukprot:GSA120T00006791001.1